MKTSPPVGSAVTLVAPASVKESHVTTKPRALRLLTMVTWGPGPPITARLATDCGSLSICDVFAWKFAYFGNNVRRAKANVVLRVKTRPWR